MLFSSLIQNEREAYFWRKNYFLWSLCSPLHIFALLTWVVQVLPSQEWREGERFRQWAKTCPCETWGTFLGCSPSPKTGQKLLVDLGPWLTWGYHWLVSPVDAWSLKGRVITPPSCSVSPPCTAGTKSCSVALMLWMSTRGSAGLRGDGAMQHGSLADGVPNQVDIHPAPNRA